MNKDALKRATHLFSIRYGTHASREAKIRAAVLEQAGFKKEAEFWLSVGKSLEKQKG